MGAAYHILAGRGVRQGPVRIMVEELVPPEGGLSDPGPPVRWATSFDGRRLWSVRGCGSTSITIFPGYLAPLREALVGRAIENGLVELAVHDLRGWTHDVHQAVDDAPYGGGPGMVMRPQVWGEALDAVIGARRRPGWSCPPRRVGRSRRPTRRRGRASRGWSSPAAATRASTSG